ncbi:uncharacterized protein LOC116840351 isoform X1 [Odontomachus brunneus]|uniref:uncharacterized protein LOC116840351 isoform X1 n=1 Tax=Odontomachus brunneus TaxID=486640 RepID=UPI0013F28CBE|nr:uncharacterized protein LOC116840351 isoform X1 [Odontomachus brunneus]XP_032662849.1 uncharacterized protein LOC116840351 isoform X1 [Odontomachus brunneus]
MSASEIGKMKCESVIKMGLIESFRNLEIILKPSEQFLQIYGLSFKFYKNRKEFSNTQIKIMESKMSKLFYKIIYSKITDLDDTVTLATAYYNVCNAYILSDQKKELSIAKNFILHCLDLMKDKELDPKFILLGLKAHYGLGFLYDKLNKPKETIHMYDKAISLYFAYTNDENHSLIDFKDIVVKSRIPLRHQEALKNMYIIILTSLVQVHTDIKPRNNPSLIMSIHFLLVAEWHRLPQTKTYFKWIDRAITLCYHLLMYNCFKEAQYYFTVAIYLRVIYFDRKCNCIRKKETFIKVCEWCNQSIAMVPLFARYQVKHAITLFRKSAERLLSLKRDNVSDNLKLEDFTKSKDQFLQELLLFSGVENEYLVPREFKMVMSEYISDYNNAQQIFSRILNLLYGMGIVFNKGDIKIYENIVLDICKAYKYMALFEKDTSSRILLQRRRAEILCDTIVFIRLRTHNVPKFFLLQLAIIYSTLIDIKFENLDTDYLLFTPLSHNNLISEINDLLNEGLTNLFFYMNNT